MEPTLLIADGDAHLCDIYRQFFAEHGFAVEIASHGLECLEKLYELRPAVIVLDLELRWGRSEKVLASLRAPGATQRPPVILTGPATSPDDMSEFIKPPVVRFLRKPFTPMALLESARAAMAETEGDEPFWVHWSSPPTQTIRY